MFTCAQMDSKQAYLVSIGNTWLCFSYETLVCISNGKHFYETKTYHSSTTRHINEFHRRLSTQFSIKHNIDNIEMLANQLIFETTKEMIVESITE